MVIGYSLLNRTVVFRGLGGSSDLDLQTGFQDLDGFSQKFSVKSLLILDFNFGFPGIGSNYLPVAFALIIGTDGRFLVFISPLPELW